MLFVLVVLWIRDTNSVSPVLRMSQGQHAQHNHRQLDT